jgi:hypothetical protein
MVDFKICFRVILEVSALQTPFLVQTQALSFLQEFRLASFPHLLELLASPQAGVNNNGFQQKIVPILS